MQKVEHSRAVENILACYYSGSDNDREYGSQWYQDANRWCRKEAKALGIPRKTFTAIVAVLSPSNRWERNQKDAINLVNFGSEVKVSTYNANKRKALAILATNDVSILRGEKVVSFFKCIYNPKAEQVVIDRHAIRIYAGKYFSVLNKSIRPALYERARAAYRDAAAIIDQTPAAVQAATWTTYRNSLLLNK